MLEKQYNHHLCFRLAITPGDFTRLFAKLPPTVMDDLETDLVGSDEARALPHNLLQLDPVPKRHRNVAIGSMLSLFLAMSMETDERESKPGTHRR